jgi:hypothetical protein
LLELLYEGASTEKLAEYFGRPVVQVLAKANSMGLHKNREYMAGLAEASRLRIAGAPYRYPKGHVPANKGLRRPGYAPGRMRETQFKKGGASHYKWMPVGAERLIEGYRYRKVSDVRNVPYTVNWKLVHVLSWESLHGPVPPGHAVVFKNGDKADTRDENLELVTRAELMRRNSIHNLPRPLAQVIQLRGVLVRQINKRTRAAS